MEKKILVFTTKRTWDTNSETFRGLFPSQMSLSDRGAELYERIHKKKCLHRFREAREIRVGPYKAWLELSVADEILRAFARTGDDLAADKSYAIIRKHRPIDNGDGDFESLMRLSESVALATTSEDWHSIIDWHSGGSPPAEDPRKNLPRLRRVLASNDSHVRLNAIDRLAELNDPAAWDALAPLLDDPAVARPVANHVLMASYPKLLGKALRYFGLKDVSVEQSGWPFPPEMWPWHPNMSDEQIRALLRQEDIWVDAYCLPYAWLQNRLSLIDDVIATLNNRPSLAAKVAVEQLIAGPWPFGQITWGDVTTNSIESRPPLSAAYREPWVVLLDGRIDTSWQTGEVGEIQREVLALGRQASPQNWARIQSLTTRWIEKGGSQWWVAAFAQALKSCDLERTRAWLREEILRLTDARAHRFTCILAAVGAVADPALIPALEDLADRMTKPESGSYWYSQHFVDYALHRSRNIHNWTLTRGTNGNYTVVRQPGFKSERRTER